VIRWPGDLLAPLKHRCLLVCRDSPRARPLPGARMWALGAGFFADRARLEGCSTLPALPGYRFV